MTTRRPIPSSPVIVALILWAVVGSISLVLAGRALAGAFDEPVSAAIPLLATLLTLCGSLIAWTLFHQEGRHGDVGRRLWDGLLSLLPPGVAGFAAAVNAGPVTLAAIVCLMTCGLCYVVIREGTRDDPAEAATATPSLKTDPSSSVGDQKEFSVVATEETAVMDGDSPHLSQIQHITRQKQSGAGETIEAVLLARFSAGERQTSVHLPIHPVLRSQPAVECEPIDDGSVSVRAAFVSGYGVRVDVKRSENITEAKDIAIGVLVTSPESVEVAA